MKISGTLEIMVRAVMSGMKIVKLGQRGEVGAVETKQGDGHNTVVTKWDKVSEAAILEVLLEAPYNVRSEEVGFVENVQGEQTKIFLVDPLDGSKPFAIGAPTSTISVALYDLEQQTVLSVVVGEPSTGKVMLAEVGLGTWYFYGTSNLKYDLSVARRAKVWPGVLDSGSVVLVDCYHGFRLAGHPVVPNETWGRLMEKINDSCILYGMGTNCGHLALLALGRNSVVGSITTCRGGPHDITPGLLVSEAGGIVRAFSNKSGEIVEVRPLAVLEANFMIATNNESTAELLKRKFLDCFCF